MDLPPALYLPADDGWLATALTIGPWDAGLQHAGPPAALLLREAERAGAIPGGQTVRMAFDVLGPVPVGPLRTTASVVRPGRRVELVEATMCGEDGRPLMRLTAWRLRIPRGLWSLANCRTLSTITTRRFSFCRATCRPPATPTCG